MRKEIFFCLWGYLFDVYSKGKMVSHIKEIDNSNLEFQGSLKVVQINMAVYRIFNFDTKQSFEVSTIRPET